MIGVNEVVKKRLEVYKEEYGSYSKAIETILNHIE